MPMENHKDTFFLPPGPTQEDVEVRTRRDSAIRAINNRFAIIKQDRTIEHITIDRLVAVMLKLKAVNSYICYGEAYPRKKQILAHISMKIKEYIDGK